MQLALIHELLDKDFSEVTEQPANSLTFYLRLNDNKSTMEIRVRFEYISNFDRKCYC